MVYRPDGSSVKWGVYAARTDDWPGALPTEVTLDATVGDCGVVNDAAGWDYCPLPRGVLEPGTTYDFKIFARTSSTLGKYSSVVTYTPPEVGGEGLVEQAGGWGSDPNPEPASPGPDSGDGSSPSDPVVADPDGSGPIVVAPDPVEGPGSAKPTRRPAARGEPPTRPLFRIGSTSKTMTAMAIMQLPVPSERVPVVAGGPRREHRCAWALPSLPQRSGLSLALVGDPWS